jgi:uncharacterized protein YgiM (DUF1202 family)
MKDDSRVGSMVVLAVAALLIMSALAGCTGLIGERLSNITNSLNPAPTATTAPPTDLPATATPTPTRVTPSPPPSLTATTRPTRTPTLTPSVTPTPGPDAVVTADALTLRAGPGTVYARIGTLRNGEPLSVTARTKNGDWLAVTTQAGKQGWVAGAYVQLNVALEEIPLATEVPPTPLSPSRTPAQPELASPTRDAGQSVPTSPAPEATTGPSVDDEIAKINRGDHGQLPQPPMIGGVAAGGEAELTILNDTPYVLTVLIGSPNQTTITVEKCPTCSTYGFVGPSFCQEEGRPRQTIRIKPGTMKVAARVDNPSVIPFSGEWTLKSDNAYFNCFFIITR